MITGYNTDIEYEGVTYHVQTEDKGLETPLILSLVYDRGTILASKRSPYDDLLANFDEKVLAEKLQKQHKLICAAIRGGRIEDLKRMTMRESASRKKGLIVQKEIKPRTIEKTAAPVQPENSLPELKTEQTQPVLEKIPVEKVPVIEKIPVAPAVKEEIPLPPIRKEEIPLPQVLHLADERFQDIKQPETKFPSEVEKLLKTETEIETSRQEETWEIPIISLSAEDLIFEEEDETIEEVFILPAEAVEIITDFSKHEEPLSDTLTVELLNEVSFQAGEDKIISVLVSRGRSENTISGASVMVKVLGSNFRPLIFHSKTDSNGVATVRLHLPNFSRGRAAVLIKANSGNDEAELRRIIRPN